MPLEALPACTATFACPCAQCSTSRLASTRQDEALFSCQHALQPGSGGRPLVVGNAVHDGVALVAVLHDHVLAQHTFADGAQPLDCALGGEVARVGLELDTDGAQSLEGVAKEQILTLS